MPILYELTPELRTELKHPLGTLIRGSFVETMKRIRDMVERESPPAIVSVGDTVSRNLLKNHVHPQLSIVDNRCMRRSIPPTFLAPEKTVRVRNARGTIAEDAIGAIRDALKTSQRTLIVVEGEEDLLTLIVIMYAPQNSFVIYGQPREGVVVVKATTEKKAQVSEILKAMETVRKPK
jgi:uncharacterized protein (UPF0218 family)